MNLAKDPWIPCIRQDGTSSTASLLDCFTCNDIADIAVRPHERVALMRLLLCIGYAAAGIPADYDEWEALKVKLPSAVTDYLKKWEDSFELFHAKKPFLQVAGLRKAKNDETCTNNDSCTQYSKLDFSLASGNNSTIWDHDALSDRNFSPEWLALNLLTYQMFCISGTCGNVYWNNTQINENCKNGICIQGSMLHTFLRCERLLNTIHVNMLSEEELTDFKRLSNNWQGRPVWELFPSGFDDSFAIGNATQTFLGRMVPLTVTVLLSPDGGGMLMGRGLSYPVYPAFPPEVTATVYVAAKKNERKLLSTEPDKSIWRQLAAMTVMRHGDELGGCAALVHTYNTEDVDLVVCGVAEKAHNIEDIVESVFHVPSSIYQTEGHEIYEHEVSVAEDVAHGLGEAVERYRRLVDGGWESRLLQQKAKKNELKERLKAPAFRYYWTAVETGLSSLWNMVKTVGSDVFLSAKKDWHDNLEKSAYAAYAVACGTETERQMRAYIQGIRILKGTLRKSLECNSKHNGDKE